MKRTPIIIVGQVYLHNELNDYVVVTKSTRGDICFRGPGFNGMNEIEKFLERFSPVDPTDLTQEEVQVLMKLQGDKPMPLSVGWVPEDDESDHVMTSITNNDEDDEQ